MTMRKLILVFLFLPFALTGCGGGGGGNGDDGGDEHPRFEEPQPRPGSSNWDQMQWNQSSWQ